MSGRGQEGGGGEPRFDVVVADDEPDVRWLVRRLLERDGRFRVVGEAGDGVAAVEVVGELQPHAVLLDLMMPVRSGAAAVRPLAAVAPGTMVGVLSGLPATQHEPRLRALGAFAFYEKANLSPQIGERLHADLLLFQRALDGEEVVAPSHLPQKA